MKLDTTLETLLNELLAIGKEPDTGYVKLADLVNTKRTLTVRPRRRTYLNQTDAGYDWASGKEFVVVDRLSAFNNQIVAVDETPMLKRYGYEAVNIEYNRSVRPLEISL